MKIAYVYDAVYPWIKGGAEKRIYEISIRLVEKGHDVHWYGIKWWDGPPDIMHEGIHVHGLCNPRPLYVNGKRSIAEALIFAFRVLPSIKEKFDVIECHQAPYFPCFPVKIYSMIQKVPLVITWHEYWGDYWYEYLGISGLFGYYIEKLVSSLSSHQIAVSGTTKQRLSTIAGSASEVISNGIDFGRIQQIQKSAAPSDVIFAGRLIKEKNLDVLIKAISRVKESLPALHCVIVGNGPEQKNLENLVHELQVTQNITFRPFFENHDDLIATIKASKICVLPSSREGFSIVALEALACGVPVVTTDHMMNATTELVTEKTGYVCRLADEDFARAILAGLNHYHEMTAECIRKARMYDWSTIVDYIETYYSTIASER